jgi:hypothetical protein
MQKSPIGTNWGTNYNDRLTKVAQVVFRYSENQSVLGSTESQTYKITSLSRNLKGLKEQQIKSDITTNTAR